VRDDDETTGRDLYLKLGLRYAFLVLDTYHPDTIFM
jgi:hypothetical protein